MSRWTWAAAVAAFGLAGCGPNEVVVPVYPVTGKVLVDGQPVDGVQVSFVFVGERPPGFEGNPRATTKADGSFTLSTRAASDGAPAGTYKVIVGKLIEEGGSSDAVVRNLLPAAYASADSTPLSATVEPKPNALSPFEVKSQ